MGCMRKRGKSWNAQVRVSGWRTFTKSFKTKLSATEWVANFEKELRSKPIPKKDIKNLKLKNLFNKYKLEILPKLKSYKIVSYKLINLSRSWLGDIVVINLTKRYLEQFCEDRKLKVQEGTVKSELMLIKRIFKIAIDKWNYGMPLVDMKFLPLTNQEIEEHLKKNQQLLYSIQKNKKTNTSPLSFSLLLKLV